jgi:cell shape-determining protein MreC
MENSLGNSKAPYVIDVGRTSTSITEFIRGLPVPGLVQVSLSKVGLCKVLEFSPFAEAYLTLEVELTSNK